MQKKLCVLLAGVIGAGLLLSGCSGGDQTQVAVQSVSMITDYGSMGMYDRYAGIVEAGETIDIQKSDSMEVDEILVKAGQDVKKGQTLFTYNTETAALELDKLELELEQLHNTVTTKNSQIQALEKERSSAAASDKLDYTLQIQELQLDVKETEYNAAAKEKEVERAKATLENAEVTAPADGTVSAVNKDGETDDYGNAKPFMSLTQSGDFRVKGTVNERNIAALAEGTPVLVRSRVDDTVYTGVIAQVDTSHPVSGNSDGVYYGNESDEMTSSSKYPFYVTLESDEGLMLGQHVYIEPDFGQQEQQALALPANYVVDPDGSAYVWAANSKDKLEKRPVTLGEFDEELYTYEILDGLSLTDYIADPSQDCQAGAPVEYYNEESFDGGEEDYMEEDPVGAEGGQEGDAANSGLGEGEVVPS